MWAPGCSPARRCLSGASPGTPAAGLSSPSTSSRGHNMLDSGAHFYETYRTSDDLYMSVGCIEPQFYQTFLDKLGLTDDDLPQFDDFDELKVVVASAHPCPTYRLLQVKVKEIFGKKTRQEWCEIFDGCDACVTPVLGLKEAPSHPQNAARCEAGITSL